MALVTQAEIRRLYGYRAFSSGGVEPELVEWLRRGPG